MNFIGRKVYFFIIPLLIITASLSLLMPSKFVLAEKNQLIAAKFNNLPLNREVALYRLLKNSKIKSANDSDGDGIIDYFDNGSKNKIEKTFKIRAIKPFSDEFDLKVEIPQDRLDYYKKLNQPEIKKAANFPYLATSQDPVLTKIVGDLGDLYLQNYENGNKFYLLNTILEVGRNIKYENDDKISSSGDYWKFPVETLADGRGDCEDMALLLAGLLKNAGFDVILVDFRTHMGIALAIDDTLIKSTYGDNLPLDYYEYKGIKYYYLETTDLDDYRFGEVPEQYKNIKPTFYEVN